MKGKSFAGFFMFLSLGLVFMTGNLYAQQGIQVQQTTVTVPKKELIRQNMIFDSSTQATSFWGVYEEYELELDKIYQRLEELIRFYAQNYHTLSDAQAGDMIDKYLAIESDRNTLRTSYVDKFKAVLSAKQVARFYQIENKLEAIARIGLVEGIPLVRVQESSPPKAGPGDQPQPSQGV